MDCPLPLRGHHYSSSRIIICNAYSPCSVCSECQNFDKHSAMCQRCEGRKPKQYRTCNCTSSAKVAKKRAEQVFRRPLFAPEGLDPSLFTTGVNIAEDQTYSEVGRQLQDAFGSDTIHRLGSVPGMDNVQQVEEDTGEIAALDHDGRSYVI